MSEKEQILSLIDSAVFMQEVRIKEIEKDIQYWEEFHKSPIQKKALEQWKKRKEIALAKRDECLKILRLAKEITA